MSTLWRGEVVKVAEVPQDLEGFLHSLKVVSRLTLEGPMPGPTALAKLERLQGHGGGLWQMHWLSLLLPCMSHQLL